MAKRKSKVTARSAAVKKVAKVRSAARPFKSTARGAAIKKVAKVRSAAEPLGVTADVGAAVASPASANVLAAALPLQQSIDAEQRAIINSPEGANIFDVDIGFGVALPGETGVSAVERIKAERKKINRKAKVAKKR